jgi:hypothetical protein
MSKHAISTQNICAERNNYYISDDLEIGSLGISMVDPQVGGGGCVVGAPKPPPPGPG